MIKKNSLYGTIVYLGNCFQVELLSKGFGTISEWNIGASKYSVQMRKAEYEAKKKET